MRSNTLADNRALLQVLTHSENTGQSPEDIVKTAVAGGVVGLFVDEKKRHSDAILLPSSRDISTLAVLIAEGFFAPFLRRAVGDFSPHCTIMAESGCFEPFSLSVLLFPDCFLTPSSSHPTARGAFVLSRSPVKGHGNDGKPETTPTPFSVMPAAEVADTLQLHRLRSFVGLSLFKSVNEVLYDAEVSKLQRLKHKTTSAACEAIASTSVIALFYELKILLLCCIVSTNKAYALEESQSEERKSAQNYFEELLLPKDVREIFNYENRRSASDVAKWYDDVLSSFRDRGLVSDSDLQGVLLELQTKVVEEGQRVSRMPLQLLHRPHNAASSTTLRLSFAHAELPHLAPQPGELTLLLHDPPGHSLLFDSNPSKLCLLLRRCSTVRLTGTQLRSAEFLLSKLPWCKLGDAVVESVQRHLFSNGVLSFMVEKNSSFVARLVQWLRETSSAEEEDAEFLHGEEAEKRKALGASIANDIVEHAIQTTSFGTAIAQLIHELVNCGALGEKQFHTWVERSLQELGGKPSATIELFALVVVFSLAHRGWDLPEKISEPVIKLCTQYKQEPNCLKLLNLLLRYS